MAENHGGRYIHRGGKMFVDDTALWKPTRMVVIEFPTMEAAQGFLMSEDYQPVKALRHKYATSTSVILETD
jgi:uncharacterized protein (DUF1330 family)